MYFGCEGPKGISGAAFLPREQKQTWVLNLITRHVRDRAKQEENQEDNTHSVRQRAVIQPSRVGSLSFRCMQCPLLEFVRTDAVGELSDPTLLAYTR